MTEEKQIRILNVEDEEVDHVALKRMVKEKGLPYEVDIATTIAAAMELIEKNSYDVILIDYNMPDGTGLELLEKIKGNGIVSIFVTGSGNEIVAVKAMKGGAYDYIIKDHAGGYLELISARVAKALHAAQLEKEQKRNQEKLKQTLEKLRRSLGGTIQTVELIVETKDPYTAGHQRRVADLARAIATEMGLSEEQIDGIRMAGSIHDLGKISVPAEILSKPGRLTENEISMIKNHPQIGYDILKNIEFPWPVAQIVLQHHERLDGSGYPHGLSGEGILLEARILAVADVVEAMSSHRPYRPALGIEKALEEISHNRGILYDLDVVDACLKLFTEKGFKIEKETQDKEMKPTYQVKISNFKHQISNIFG